MTNKYPELDAAIEKSKIQKKNIYQPSAFWEDAANKIVQDIEAGGIGNFRRLKTPLGFFVPTYGIPANSFTSEIADGVLDYIKKKGTNKQLLAMQTFLRGFLQAESDYKVFISSDQQMKEPILFSFSESQYGNPIEQFEFQGRRYSRSALNYILGICFLKKYLTDNEPIHTVLEIGGGFGTLGEILKQSRNIKYIDIDIPPVSYIAWDYLRHNYQGSDIEPYVNHHREIQIKDLKKCSVFNAWDIEILYGKVDLFVNFISFQEMEPFIVENYLSHVKRLRPTWVLLRNMREGKQVKTGPDKTGVDCPIKKDDYTKLLSDTHELIASNVVPFGYKTVDGFHSELLLFRQKRMEK